MGIPWNPQSTNEARAKLFGSERDVQVGAVTFSGIPHRSKIPGRAERGRRGKVVKDQWPRKRDLQALNAPATTPASHGPPCPPWPPVPPCPLFATSVGVGDGHWEHLLRRERAAATAKKPINAWDAWGW